jgi:hypothetical protein
MAPIELDGSALKSSALRAAADDLPLDQHRIDGFADIVCVDHLERLLAVI